MYPTVRPSFDVELRTPGGSVYVAVDGCFWHACPDHYRRPKTRPRFWERHVEEAERLRMERRRAFAGPWIRIWEHDVHAGRDLVVGMVKLAVAAVEADPAVHGELTFADLLAAWKEE
jgi:DNA mismatch endonuclease (patch repair protein)